MDFPIRKDFIHAALVENGVERISEASIRETVGVIKSIEAASGINFLRMDMGVPGLPTPQIAIDTEIAALQNGLSAVYGQIDGIPPLKKEASRFAKNFLNIDVKEQACIVTVGAMMGAMIAFMVAAKRYKHREGVLFFDPGFPVQKRQAMVMNLPVFSLEVFKYRGDKLHGALEKMCTENPISMIIYSNPNNPTWACLTEKELEIIGNIATKYDIIVVEDLAYFGMDFRKDYSIPGQPPFQPTIASYTHNYLILISSSKVFSYAGQRVGIMLISEVLFNSKYTDLLEIGYSEQLGQALVMDGVYVLSAGASHTAQHGLTAMLRAVNNGEYKFLEPLKEYQQRAAAMKKIFLKHGFQLAYKEDGEDMLADGFYFTILKEGISTEALCLKFLQFGLGAISLAIAGSTQVSGVRICVSSITPDQFKELEYRLDLLDKNC